MTPSTTPDRPAAPGAVVLFDTGSNGALYVDGTLATTGSIVDVLRAALDAAGVEVSTSEDFLLGKTPKSARDFKAAAAPTLEAIEQFVSVRAQVADLRARAEALEAEAAALEATLTTGTHTETDPLGLGDVDSSDETLGEQQ